MSRSYKKNPGFTDYSKYTTFWYKRYANKKVRKNKDVPNGGAFKRLFCSYDIHDYKYIYYNKFEIIESWYYKKGIEYKIYIK